MRHRWAVFLSMALVGLMRGGNLRELSRTDGWAGVLALVVSGELEFCGGFVPIAAVR